MADEPLHCHIGTTQGRQCLFDHRAPHAYNRFSVFAADCATFSAECNTGVTVQVLSSTRQGPISIMLVCLSCTQPLTAPTPLVIVGKRVQSGGETGAVQIGARQGLVSGCTGAGLESRILRDVVSKIHPSTKELWTVGSRLWQSQQTRRGSIRHTPGPNYVTRDREAWVSYWAPVTGIARRPQSKLVG